MLSISLANMIMSDRVIYEWLKNAINSHAETPRDGITLTSSQIAEGAGCHRNTVRRCCNRLESARLIKIDRVSKRDGYVYRLAKND